MTLYICTVGTSIAGRPQPGVSLDARIADNLATKRARHGDDLRAFLIDAAAETNVLARRDCGPADTVLLLVTDTSDGAACGAALLELIEAELGARSRVEAIEGLQVANAGALREKGLPALIRKARAAAREAAERGEAVAFNVTGGFKGVVPYLTLLGMFENADILYVFDQTDALVRLPVLPIRMDAERIAPALPMLQALSGDLMDEGRFADLARRGGWAGDPMIGLLFERDAGQVCLSAAGELALDAPAPGRRVGRLLIHPRARRAVGGAGVQRELPRMNDLAMRSIPLHRASHPNTDLTLWKTIGPMAPRLFYWLEGDDVWLADILSHDDYDTTVLKGPGLWRADYPAERFQPLDLETADDRDAYPTAFSEFIAAVDDERAALAVRVKALEGELEEARDQAGREARRGKERKRALEAVTSPLVFAAADVAAEAHRDQKRKDGVTPYLEHLRAVVRILAVEGAVGDAEVLAAGYLHDVIEDQQVPGLALERRFGARVRALVEAVSDDKSLDKQTRKRLQVEHAPTARPDVVLLKLADKIANLRDLIAAPPADWPDARRLEYVDWADAVGKGLTGRGTRAHSRLEAAFRAALDQARAALG